MAPMLSVCSPNGQILPFPLPPHSFASPSSTSHLAKRYVPRPLPRQSRGVSSTRVRISCKADGSSPVVDRRNVLLGLGGLYGATKTLVGLDGKALANPVVAPDIRKCHTALVPADSEYSSNCCPPFPTQNIVDYDLPIFTKIRTRKPAHAISREELEKYKAAVQAMKELPDDDPHSFVQQAKIHCAYCNFGYDQLGFEGVELQVHGSCLFFPFHRWYLYFYERILGKLIGDDQFCIPFWNWDHPDGMTMPAIFTADASSPLYDSKRDPTHLPPVIVDYDNSDDSGLTVGEQVESNLCTMYRQMVSGATTRRLFFGQAYVAGVVPDDGADRVDGAGTIESVPHNTIHQWSGNKDIAGGEDMGKLYSAGYDSMFYSHHMNVDRMWNIWKTIGKNRRDCDDPDFLETTFFFYDENRRPVRVKIRDSLDTIKMGYKYQDVEIPWLKKKPRTRRTKPSLSYKITSEPTFPLVLKSPVHATVKRPKKSRSKADKENEEEILTVYGIELDRSLNAKFDVYINAPDTENLEPGGAELAGSFTNVPQMANKKKPTIKTNLNMGIGELLDDIKAEDDDSIIVTIVPRKGRNRIKIGGIKIRFETI